MGIIEQKRKSSRNVNAYNKRQDKDQTSTTAKILDLTYLKKMIDNVYRHHRTEVSTKDLKHHRRWTYLQEYRLQNLLGYVDTPTFVYMLESILEFAIESRAAVQPNANWELYGYEYKLEIAEQTKDRAVGKDRDGKPQTIAITEDVQLLVIAIELVDVLGNEDVQYDMGRPRRQTENQLSPKMFRELLEAQNSKVIETQPSESSKEYQEKLDKQHKKITEQEASLDEMRTQMQSMQEMMAGLITELQTARSNDISAKDTPVKVTKRTKK
jgi:hypothetical protein